MLGGFASGATGKANQVEHRETFEAVADLYAEVRRGYPTALFDDLQALGALGPETDVLEVGCGAGQATGDFAVRAHKVLAVDPGAGLIANARRLIDAANVEFQVATFEDFAPPPGGFQLVASAQAWHWVDPAIGVPKAAAALSEGGHLAIFGHVPIPPTGALSSALRAVFEAHVPGAWGQPSPQNWYLPAGPVAGMITEAGFFGPVEHRAYAWSWRLDPETFGRYLRTDSTYHFLSETPRFALFDAMSDAVEQCGGVFNSAWETHLYLARKI